MDEYMEESQSYLPDARFGGPEPALQMSSV